MSPENLIGLSSVEEEYNHPKLECPDRRNRNLRAFLNMLDLEMNRLKNIEGMHAYS